MITQKNMVPQNIVELVDMPESSIGRIVDWPAKEYLGLIVVRKGNMLVTLNPASQIYWANIAGTQMATNKFKIELIPAGTVFEVSI